MSDHLPGHSSTTCELVTYSAEHVQLTEKGSLFIHQVYADFGTQDSWTFSRLSSFKGPKKIMNKSKQAQKGRTEPSSVKCTCIYRMR